MNKDKLRNFLKKLNNGYIVAAICMILVFIIAFGSMIDLVAHPFITNISYSAKIEGSGVGTMKATLTLLEDGRYSETIEYRRLEMVTTTFGDYSYSHGKYQTGDNKGQHYREIFFNNDYENTHVELKNPFKLKFYGAEFTNVGGILLLVFYCIMIVISAAIATILIIKRKEGKALFNKKSGLETRVSTIEEMIGIKNDEQ